VIDLRSDFLSSATPAMLAAMAAAATDRKGYGPRGDPHQQRLEERAAELLGKADALFVPTCMMANLLAAMAVVKPGEAILVDSASHVLRSESGALAALARAITLPLPSVMGRMQIADIAAALDTGSIQQPRSAMIMLENTHNKAGGVALPRDYAAAIRGIIGSTWMHLDGSRIFNAAAALGETAASLAASADSVSVSLNKGLSAPVGAILAGPKDFIATATALRQQIGGGWRPVGMLAAPAVVALDTMQAQLPKDHRNAAAIGATLAECAGIIIDRATVQTNIVRARLKHPALTPAAFEAALSTAGILTSVGSDGAFRMVTYHDIGEPETEHVCRQLRAILGLRK